MTQTDSCKCGCASADVSPETVDALKARVKELEGAANEVDRAQWKSKAEQAHAMANLATVLERKATPSVGGELVPEDPDAPGNPLRNPDGSMAARSSDALPTWKAEPSQHVEPPDWRGPHMVPKVQRPNDAVITDREIKASLLRGKAAQLQAMSWPGKNQGAADHEAAELRKQADALEHRPDKAETDWRIQSDGAKYQAVGPWRETQAEAHRDQCTETAGIAVHPSHLPTVVDLLEDEVAKLREFKMTIVELSAYGHFERCHGEEPDDPRAIEALKTKVRVLLGSTDVEDHLEVAAMVTGSGAT